MYELERQNFKRSGGASRQTLYQRNARPGGPRARVLAARRNTEDIVKEFPGLEAEDVAACLDYARDLAEFEAVGA